MQFTSIMQRGTPRTDHTLPLNWLNDIPLLSFNKVKRGQKPAGRPRPSKSYIARGFIEDRGLLAHCSLACTNIAVQ